MYFPWCKLESCPPNACLAVFSSRLTPVPGGSLTAVQYRVPRTPRLIYLLQSPLKYVLCSPMIVHVPSSTRHQPSLYVARTYSLRVNRPPSSRSGHLIPAMLRRNPEPPKPAGREKSGPWGSPNSSSRQQRGSQIPKEAVRHLR